MKTERKTKGFKSILQYYKQIVRKIYKEKEQKGENS